MSSCAQRFGRGLAGPMAGDDIAAADGSVINSEFESAVKDRSPAACGAAAKPEGQLMEVLIRPVVSAPRGPGRRPAIALALRHGSA